MAGKPRCAGCGRKDLILMFSSILDENMRVCKRCYDEEIDQMLAVHSILEER
ncbi:MAG: hypothetical protein ACETWE_02905 [Candidatus Bathyarchaeia archaeon]